MHPGRRRAPSAIHGTLVRASGVIALAFPPSAFAFAAARPPGPAGYLAMGLLLVFILAALLAWFFEVDEPPRRDDRRGPDSFGHDERRGAR